MALEKPKNWSNWSQRRRRRWRRQNRPGGGGGGGGGGMGEPNLAMTPEYEAGRRGLDVALQQGLAQIIAQRERIPEQVTKQRRRLGTDERFANFSLEEGLAGRGIEGGSVPGFLRQRDIQIPFGRQRQDLAEWAAQMLADLATQEGQLQAAHQQGLIDLLLQRAQDVSQSGMSLFGY